MVSPVFDVGPGMSLCDVLASAARRRRLPSRVVAYARLVRSIEAGRAWRRLPGWLRRFAEIGTLPSDSEELRVRKAVLVLSSTLMASLAFVWVATYAVLGLWA